MTLEVIPGQIVVAVGASLAALVTGAFSFLNLVTSKESKISEFRQQWIDSLRTEISLYLTNIHSLLYLESTPSNTSDTIGLNKIIDEINSKYFIIQLRLNKSDNSNEIDKNFNESLVELHKNIKSRHYGNIYLLIDRVEGTASVLLKSEWKRVKEGELTYRISRYIALALLSISFVLILSFSYYFYTSINSQSSAPVIPTNTLQPTMPRGR